jgi:hypothetical protein
MSKIIAAIRIEFELKDHQPNNAARAALLKATNAARLAIDGQSGVKFGSVRAEIVKPGYRVIDKD